MQNGIYGLDSSELEKEVERTNKTESSQTGNQRRPFTIVPSQIARKPKSNPFVYVASDTQPTKPSPPPKRGINLDALQPKAPQQSSGLRIERPSSTEAPKIQVQRTSSSGSGSGIVVSTQTPAPGDELCPFCGLISFPYTALLNHILVSHRFSEHLLPVMKSHQQAKCSKCGGACTSDQQLLQHCCADHDVDVLRIIRDCRNEKWDARKKEIEDFIERHAPELNPRYKRKCNVSDSESESVSEDEDDSHVDDDYTAFIASSINAGGLGSSTQAAVIQPVLDAAKIAVGSRSGAVSSSVFQFLQKMHRCEVFMRTHDLVIADGRTFSCLICRRSFDSSVKLFEHCTITHKVNITDDVREVLWTLDREIDKDEDEEKLLAHPGLRLDLLLRSVPKAPEVIRPVALMNVPTVLVDLMLEILGDPKRVPSHLHTPKQFVEPEVIMMKLPLPLPVVFEKSEKPRNTMLGFIDTSSVRATDIQKQVSVVLNTLSRCEFFEIELERMSFTGFTDAELDDLQRACQMVILKTPDVYDPETETRSFKLIAMSKEASPENDAKLRDKLFAMFEASQLFMCKKCRSVVKANSTEKCAGLKAQGLLIQVKESNHEIDPEQPFSWCDCTPKSAKDFF